MLHWTPGRFAFAHEVEADVSATPSNMPVIQRHASRRAEHARMLEHAATRRRRASGGEERAYWRACAPAAVARAARLRGEGGLARLP